MVKERFLFEGWREGGGIINRKISLKYVKYYFILFL